jgi:MSHA biogenesis protein MshG
MPKFHYRGRNAGGELVEGDVEAMDSDLVASQLMGAGVTPINIESVADRQDALVKFIAKLPFGRPDIDDLILFSRQMYALMKAGVPITRAISGLKDTCRNKRMVEVLDSLGDNLESGRALSAAMAQHKDVFATIYISMIQVGENTGQLDLAFIQLAKHLELEKETRNRIKAAMRYPTFVILALAIAITIINLVVIPAFANVFEGFGAELPWATKVLLATSNFFVAYWPFMLVAVIGAMYGFKRWVKSEKGRLKWDQIKLKFPVVGDVIMRATLARFARTFAMASGAGVPLLQALTAVSRAVDNEYVGAAIVEMRVGIERGDALTRTAANTGLFTPLVLQMMAVGEETGAVDTLMLEVAGFYEQEVDYDLKYMGDAIEPILIIAVGIMVLILALGVFLPMWELGSAATG